MRRTLMRPHPSRRARAFALALLALGAAAIATPAQAQGLGPQVAFTRGWPLDRDGMVKIFVPNGRIRVIGWDRDSVAVTGTVSRTGSPYGGGGRRGVKLGVEGSTPGVGGDLTVRLPAGAIVSVRGAATDITVEGLTGGVDVNCVTGQVRITGDPRELIAEAMDGLLEIVGSPGTLRAKTASATLRWLGHSDEATLGSISGSIDASRGPLGRVRIETISGNVTLDAALQATADVVIESHSGSVDIRVPSTAQARISVDAPQLAYEGTGRVSPAQTIGKRTAPRTIDVNGANATTGAAVTVRSFKGEVRVVSSPAKTVVDPNDAPRSPRPVP